MLRHRRSKKYENITVRYTVRDLYGTKEKKEEGERVNVEGYE